MKRHSEVGADASGARAASVHPTTGGIHPMVIPDLIEGLIMVGLEQS